MKFNIVIASLIFSSSVAFAAVPGKTPLSNFTQKKLLNKDIEAALTALQMPSSNRARALSLQKNSFISLQQIVKNGDLPLTTRWRAMTSLGRVHPKSSLKFVVSMTESKEWFHRNSALIALKVSHPKMATVTAERLLKDRSLVVRTAAVNVLAELNSVKSREKLWSTLNDKQNFRKGQSLWVRQHIMKALAQFSVGKDRPRFAKHLNDPDKKVQLWAIDGLEKVTGLKKQFHGLSFADRRKRWVSWAEKQKLM